VKCPCRAASSIAARASERARRPASRRAPAKAVCALRPAPSAMRTACSPRKAQTTAARRTRSGIRAIAAAATTIARRRDSVFALERSAAAPRRVSAATAPAPTASRVAVSVTVALAVPASAAVKRVPIGFAPATAAQRAVRPKPAVRRPPGASISKAPRKTAAHAVARVRADSLAPRASVSATATTIATRGFPLSAVRERAARRARRPEALGASRVPACAVRPFAARRSAAARTGAAAERASS
jgi:hypothetical protein